MTVTPTPDIPTQGDVVAFVQAADDDTLAREAAFRGLSPKTRRTIIVALALIAVLAIVAEVVLRLADKPSSDALIAIAASAVGALGGMAMPNANGS